MWSLEKLTCFHNFSRLSFVRWLRYAYHRWIIQLCQIMRDTAGVLMHTLSTHAPPSNTTQTMGRKRPVLKHRRWKLKKKRNNERTKKNTSLCDDTLALYRQRGHRHRIRSNGWRMVTLPSSQSIFHVHNIVNVRFHVVFFRKRLPALYSALSSTYFRDTANSCCRSSLRAHRGYVVNYIRNQPPHFPQLFPYSFGCVWVSFTIRCRVACILSTLETLTIHRTDYRLAFYLWT